MSKRLGLLGILVACAQTQPPPPPLAVPKQPAAAPAAQPPAQAPTPASATPLHRLPYTPSLDLASMDRTANPCADFYQYSCGGWMKANPIPADQASWSVYGKLANENAQFLWGILEEAAAGKERSPTQQKIGDFFASCMDTGEIDRRGLEPLGPELRAIDGMASTADVSRLLAALQLSSEHGRMVFGFTSDQDFADATQVIAFISAGGLGLPDRDYYVKDDPKSQELRKQYVQHVQNMLQLVGESDFAQSAQAILRLETKFANASLTRVERRNPHNLDHKVSRAELKTMVKRFDWDRWLNNAKAGSLQAFNVTEPRFMRAFDAALADEPLPVWKAYLKWHLVHARAETLPGPIERENFDFFGRILRGVAELPPRWKRCVRMVDRKLGFALGEEFVRSTFSAKTKDDTLKMTKLVEDSMQEEIEKIDWMSPATKRAALAKLHAIRNKIGYPDTWRDYSALQVKRDDFFGNVRNANLFESRRLLNKIGKPLDRGEWEMTPPTVNAYYNPQMNDINFPAGVLQPPLYDPREDAAPNYGNTGSTVGHELTHGFDDEGRQFDGQGNLRDWWTAEDAKKFEERVQCVRDQFAGYTIVDDIKINSKLTSGEDVADLGGTLIAYLAWKRDVSGQALQPADGLTPEQRFFVGFAQWACENQRPENLRVGALTNPHSPGRYRINGIVADLPEFATAFSCKPGDAMVSPKPCKVW
jgi:endothelin-converting enzyme/putative endopeptidase